MYLHKNPPHINTQIGPFTKDRYETIKASQKMRHRARQIGKLEIGECVLSKQPDKEPQPFSLARKRLREIEGIILSRHGERCLPQTDDADLYIEAVAHAINADCLTIGQEGTVESRIIAWCSLWAPWCHANVIRRITRGVSKRKLDLNAKDAADRLMVRFDERERLGLVTIAAQDMSKKELKKYGRKRKRRLDRERIAEKRRAAGVVPREAYLAESLSQEKPWESLGISRASWYRRQSGETGRETTPSQLDIYNTTSDALVSNQSQAVSRCLTSQEKPWEAMGISRATWYRRQRATTEPAPDTPSMEATAVGPATTALTQPESSMPKTTKPLSPRSKRSSPMASVRESCTGVADG